MSIFRLEEEASMKQVETDHIVFYTRRQNSSNPAL
jgi:hypothetical protein